MVGFYPEEIAGIEVPRMILYDKQEDSCMLQLVRLEHLVLFVPGDLCDLNLQY